MSVLAAGLLVKGRAAGCGWQLVWQESCESCLGEEAGEDTLAACTWQAWAHENACGH